MYIDRYRYNIVLHFTSTLVGADDGPQRERGRGRGERAAGARPGTTQGKVNRQTARLK